MLVVVLTVVVLILFACVVGGSLSRRRLERELAVARDAARVEQLTRLRNRRAFREDLEIEVLRCDRAGSPVCLVILALIPDPSDDEVSEGVREQLVHVMTSEVRAVDVGYRTGVNEFAMILPNTRAWGGEIAARRVVEAFRVAGSGCDVVAGLAEGGPGLDRRKLFRNAYSALLATSRDGNASVLAYAAELDRTAPSGELEGLPEIDALDGPVA